MTTKITERTIDIQAKSLQHLSKEIADTVNAFVTKHEYVTGRPPLSVAEPEKAQSILMLLAVGTSHKKICRDVGTTMPTVARLKSDYCDSLQIWKEEGGKVSGGIYMDASERISSVMEDIEEAKEREDWKAVEALTKYMQATGKLFEVSHRQSMVARGEASQITKEIKTVTDEDIKDTAKAARERIAQMKAAEVVVDI